MCSEHCLRNLFLYVVKNCLLVCVFDIKAHVFVFLCMSGQDHFELWHVSQLCQMNWMSHMVLKRLNHVLWPPNLCFVLSCLCSIAGLFWFFLYSAHAICMRNELIWILFFIISVLFFLCASSLDIVIDFCRLSNNNKHFQPVSTVLYSK
jgi:hypothetical protein